MLLRHKAMTDVAFEVTHMEYTPSSGKLSLDVIWWNIGTCHEPYCMWEADSFSVKPEWLRDVVEYSKLY